MHLRLTALVFLAFGLPTFIFAHIDDPKEQDRQPRWEGPAWRASDQNAQSSAQLGFQSENVTLMSWLPLGEFGNQSSGNDCWGYVSPSGREYALMGLRSGTGFVEITEPDNAQIIDVISAPNSLWHDIKVYEDYCYVVSEAGSGIQVIDMSNIDNGEVELVAEINGSGTASTHNVAIDTTSGFLYRTGGGDNGLRVYSLANPSNPVFVGSWSERYVHDVQVVTYTDGPYEGLQVAFCCGGFNGGHGESGLCILDVTDKSNIEVLACYQHSNPHYSHQAWLSRDRQYLYLNDELDESNTGTLTTTRVIDVSDLEDPYQVTTFTSGTPSIDHNLYTDGDFIFESNYRSGLRVFDATDPINPVQVAWFDTYPNDDNPSFNGLWSCYPMFPSGTVIGSDIERGLFVWRIELSLISIANADQPETISSQGTVLGVDIVEEEPGGLEPGSARLVYDAGDGFVEVDMTSVGGMRWEGSVDPGECGSILSYYFQAEDANGMVSTLPSAAPTSFYTTLVADASTVAFEDDCETDQGWVVQNSAGLEDGAWSRGIPAGGGDRGDPPTDYDGSGQCYLTDNVDGNSDVDGGATTLISPAMDVTAPGAQLSYARWYSNSFGAAPASDIFEVEVNSGGSAWVTLEVVGPSGSEVNGGWYEKTWLVSDMEGITPTPTFRVRFTVSDVGDGSVIEAAVDAIAVTAYECDDGSIDGDVDGNGAVDFQDLVALLSSWGPCSPGGECPADFDGNGAVDFSDLLILLGSWS